MIKYNSLSTFTQFLSIKGKKTFLTFGVNFSPHIFTNFLYKGIKSFYLLVWRVYFSLNIFTHLGSFLLALVNIHLSQHFHLLSLSLRKRNAFMVWFDGYISLQIFTQLSLLKKRKKLVMLSLLGVVLSLYFRTNSLNKEKNVFLLVYIPSTISLSFSYLLKKKKKNPLTCYLWKEKKDFFV